MLGTKDGNVRNLIFLSAIIFFIVLHPLSAQEALFVRNEQSTVACNTENNHAVNQPECAIKDRKLEKKLKKLREYVHLVMEDSNVPGLGMGIVKDGKVIFAEGFGYRDVEKKLPVTPQTLFAIGSMTKSFTAMGIGMLVADGKIDWYEPVRTYLPEFTMKDPYITAHITLRDMVTHRTGLARHDKLWMGSPFSREEIVHKLRYLDFIYGFRERHQYTSHMYTAAGYIAGKVNNTTWDELIKERIFTPLGMTRSNTSVKDSEPDPNHATPYQIINGKATANPFFNVDNLGPGGSINSCVDDMMKWIQFNLNKGRIGDNQIVPADILITMHSPHSANDDPRNQMKSNEESFINYGLGWLLKMYRGHLYIGHSGGLPGGFSGIASFMPYDRIGVFVVNNGWSGISDVLSWYAYDLLLGFEPKKRYTFRDERPERTSRSMKETKEISTPTHSLDNFAGVYENQPFGTATVTCRDGKLWLTFYTREYELEHVRYNVFKAKYRQDMSFLQRLEYRSLLVQFCLNVNGSIDRLKMPLDNQVDTFEFVRTATAAVPDRLKDVDYFSQYTGKYDLMGDIVVVKIVQDKLIAVTSDGENNELIPVKENAFTIKGNLELSVHFKIEDQKVFAFDFKRPDGVFQGKKIK